MKRILVIGIGNRYMADKAIGIKVVETLKKQGANPPVSYLTGETDYDYCFEEILDYDYLIIIDAYVSGKNPGELTVIPLNEADTTSITNICSIHGIHLLSMLQQSKHLPQGILIGVEPRETNSGFTLSDTLKCMYYTILKDVRRIIDLQVEKLQKG